MPPICSKCQINLRPVKNGVEVLELADFGPYRLWEADEYECPRCRIRIITGFGFSPYTEHHKDDFTRLLEAARSRPATFRQWEWG